MFWSMLKKFWSVVFGVVLIVYEEDDSSGLRGKALVKKNSNVKTQKNCEIENLILVKKYFFVFYPKTIREFSSNDKEIEEKVKTHSTNPSNTILICKYYYRRLWNLGNPKRRNIKKKWLRRRADLLETGKTSCQNAQKFSIENSYLLISWKLVRLRKK